MEDSRDPHYPRRILLVVTGLSPQIVTETLYALGVTTEAGKPGFVPTEIHLLTTSRGAELARDALLNPDDGHFHALLADYPQLGRPTFNDRLIHVIRDAQGQPLSDIRTPEENSSAADTITALMAELTRDLDASLHVSIAGGRKTMGFYLGYAFSLFARPQDELSHVLVSSPFENHPEFFYPPATPRRLVTHSAQHVDTSDAIITLARIPVVRLRHGQPQALLAGHASFSDTVAAIQRSLARPHLRIQIQAKIADCGGTCVHLPPILFAWFAWWAEQALRGSGMQSWRTANVREFLDIYRAVVGPDAVAYENTAKRLKDGMEKAFFGENNSKLGGRLRDQLGFAAAPYLLASTGKRPHTMHSLTLPTQAIELLP